MNALLVKDWMTSKGLIKNYLLILVIYAVIAYVNDNVYLFSGLLIMIPLLMVINSMAYDERANTNKLMLASGISRKQLALSKYVFALILIIVMTVVNTLVVGMIVDLSEAVLTSLFMGLIGMTYVSLLLPVIYKFGTEKARIYMMIGFLIPFAGVIALSPLMTLSSVELNEMVMMTIIVLVCLILIGASILLSYHIVERKDY
ncbi:MAG: ABC-2 transporter permease [Erysipelotrichaceae bacterium]|nr:ABC-2 transporter permease [Erysipelotrichaceae bacterium]